MVAPIGHTWPVRSLDDLLLDGYGLPFAAAVGQLQEAVAQHGTAMVEAPPGTGKTTLGPPAVASIIKGRVVVTQPRRVAARAAARRLASLTGTAVGELAGFTVRGESSMTASTRIEMVTPGVLLRRLVGDPGLEGVGAVILDEVHERGLDTDLLVGLLGEVRQLRQDLTVVAMSATADSAEFARLLGGAPVIGVPGQAYPLTTRYVPGPRATDGKAVTRAFLEHVGSVTIRAFHEAGGQCDVLVFLPGVREVRVVADHLRSRLDAQICELHSQVSTREQDAAIAQRGPGQRARVIVATNIAESSVTVGGVRVVVDSGLVREPRRDASRGMTGLVTLRCARSSADQRAGRAARLGPGTVWRCYDEETYPGLQPHVTPEAQTGDLTAALLTLAAWGAPRGETLHLPSALPSSAVREDEDVLKALGAVDEAGRITPEGRVLSDIPASPRWARALLDGSVLVGSRAASEVVAAVELGASGDLAREIGDLQRGVTPLASRWKRETGRLERLIPHHPAAGGELGAVVVLAFPERVARRTGDVYLLASGTRAVAPAGLDGPEWLAVAEVTRSPPSATAGTGAMIRSAIPVREETVRLAHGLLTDEVHGTLTDGRIRARRVTSLGAIELTSTPVPVTALGPTAVLDVLIRNGLDSIGFSEGADMLRRRLAIVHRYLGTPWPEVSDAALLAHLDEWLAPELATAGRSGRLDTIDLAPALRRLVPWQIAGRLDELAPERLQVPSGSRVRLDYPPHDSDGPIVASVKLQECFGLASSPRLVDGAAEVVFHLLSPAGRPLAITADLASFWSGPYAQVRAEMRGRYPRHPWPEDPWSASPTSRTNRRR